MSNREEMYERARNKSVGEEKKVRYVKMTKEAYIARLKTTFLAGAMIAVLATSAVVYGGQAISKNLSESKIVREETSSYSQLVNKETHRTDDNQHYFYDTYDIASELTSDQDNIDKGIYGVYMNIGYNEGNKIEQMNDVISSVDFQKKAEEAAQKFNSFNDYVVSKGFVDKDGKADYNAYEAAMTNMIVNEHNANEMQSQVDEIKSR
jgi:hypothetical protein